MLAEEPATPFRLRCADRLSRGLEILALKATDLVHPRPLAARQPRPRDLREGLRAFAQGADHRALGQRRPAAGALRGEERRAGLPGEGQDRPRAAAARDAVLDRAQALPGGARAPGQLRRAHRAAEPPPAPRPAAPGGVRAAQRALHRGGVHRPRPLQGDQRQPGPQLRRRGPAPRGRAAAVGGARRRHRGAHRAATSSC